MKLIKLLAFAIPVLLLTSCSDSSSNEPVVESELASAKILQKSGVQAENVLKYEITLDSSRLAELTGVDYEERGTNVTSTYRIFYSKGAKVDDKELVVYTEEQQSTLTNENFKDFTSAESIKLDSTSKTLLADGGKIGENLFKDLTSLKKVDLTNFDFKDTIILKGLFQNDKALETVIFTECKMDKVKSLNSAFEGTGITTTKMPGLNTSKVEDFYATFKSTTKLKTVDLSDYSFKSAKDIRSMFEGACDFGSTVVRPKEFSFRTEEKGTDLIAERFLEDGTRIEIKANDVFKNINYDYVKTTLEKSYVPGISAKLILAYTGLSAEQVKAVKISTNPSEIENLQRTYDDLRDIKTAEEDELRIAHSGKKGVLIIQSSKALNLAVIDRSLLDTYTSMAEFVLEEKNSQILGTEGIIEEELFKNNKTITYVGISLNPQKTKSLKGLFQNASELNKVFVNLGDSTIIDDITSLFEGTAITNISLSDEWNNLIKLDFSKIIRYDAMFKNCKQLEVIDLGNLSLKSAKSIASMFEGAGAERITDYNKVPGLENEGGTDFKVLDDPATILQAAKNSLLEKGVSRVVNVNHGEPDTTYPVLADNVFEGATEALKNALIVK